MEAVKNEGLLDRKVALRLVKDDYSLLQTKVERVLLNITVPGSLSRELDVALEMTSAEIPLIEAVEDADLEAAVRALVTMAHYSRVLIDNALIPGDMVEETYNVYVMCKYLEDRWIVKND